MHIGFLTSEYPGITQNYGGIATSIKSMVTELNRQGHCVTVFVYGVAEDSVFETDLIKYISIKKIKIKGIGWWFNKKKIEHIINKEVKSSGLDLIEAPDWTGITSFMNLVCPTVVKLHGSDAYFCHIEGRKQKYKNFYFEKKALYSSDAVISVSRYAAELTQKIFHYHKKIAVIYNGIDIEKFTPVNNIKTNKILYFGTLIRKKGALEIPEIFNKVFEKEPNSKLYLIGNDSADVVTGSPSTWQLMQPLFNEKAIKNVEYLGAMPHEALLEHIHSAHVCIFPSFAETFGLTWVEAMACGKAIVSSNIGWANEIIQDQKSGLTEYPSNHRLFAKKILSLLADRQLAETLGNNARLRAEKYFSLTKIVKEHIIFYNELIQKGKK